VITAVPELRRRVGHPDQLYGTRLTRIVDGPGDGIRTLHVWNAAGLRCELLVDRGFDLYRLEHRGQPVQWTGPPGLRSRFAYEPQGWGWLRNFHGGLLMTCGLEHVLLPIDRPTPEYQVPVDEPVHFGLHGRVANEGATLVAHEIVEDADEPLIRIRGRVVQASIFRESLWLERTVEIPLLAPTIRLRDVVVNAGFAPTHHELLYHVNLGYPLIDDGTTVRVPGGEPIVATRPQAAFAEVVTEHDMASADGQRAEVIVESAAGRVLSLRYSSASLPHFYVWYMMGEGAYAIGLEPSTVGRDRADVTPDTYLQPGERCSYELEFSIADRSAA
jgi:hypothetical protein